MPAVRLRTQGGEAVVELSIEGDVVRASGRSADPFRERAVRGMLMFGDPVLALEFAVRGCQYLMAEWDGLKMEGDREE